MFKNMVTSTHTTRNVTVLAQRGDDYFTWPLTRTTSFSSLCINRSPRSSCGQMVNQQVFRNTFTHLNRSTYLMPNLPITINWIYTGTHNKEKPFLPLPVPWCWKTQVPKCIFQLLFVQILFALSRVKSLPNWSEQFDTRIWQLRWVRAGARRAFACIRANAVSNVGWWAPINLRRRNP